MLAKAASPCPARVSHEKHHHPLRLHRQRDLREHFQRSQVLSLPAQDRPERTAADGVRRSQRRHAGAAEPAALTGARFLRSGALLALKRPANRTARFISADSRRETVSRHDALLSREAVPGCKFRYCRLTACWLSLSIPRIRFCSPRVRADE